MTNCKLSPSLLEYEPEIKQKQQEIKQILNGGAQALHIDVMEEPFVPANKFSTEKFKQIFDQFKDATYDIHIMSDCPDEYIQEVSKILPAEKRKETLITTHIEAYRFIVAPKLSVFLSKDIDLLSKPDPMLREADRLAKLKVLEILKMLKENGFRTGIALEPGTSLDNLTPEILNFADIVLLMSVISGAGGQKYWDSVTNKIKEARKKFPSKEIQVDGGINKDTISTVVQAGAQNIVIGSHITGSKDLPTRINEIFKQIQQTTRK